MESACREFQTMISAYQDGELRGRDRSRVEIHLSGCAECRARMGAIQSLGSLVSERLSQQADEVDFSRFADNVLKKLSPHRPSLLQRIKIAWSEIVSYHRVAVFSSAITAAVTLLIATPIAYKLASNAIPPEVVLQDLQLEDPSVKPVVMQMENGKTLIMLVRQPVPDNTGIPADLNAQPTGGEL